MGTTVWLPWPKWNARHVVTVTLRHSMAADRFERLWSWVTAATQKVVLLVAVAHIIPNPRRFREKAEREREGEEGLIEKLEGLSVGGGVWLGPLHQNTRQPCVNWRAAAIEPEPPSLSPHKLNTFRLGYEWGDNVLRHSWQFYELGAECQGSGGGGGGGLRSGGVITQVWKLECRDVKG